MGVRKLISIDLSAADTSLFEAYERKALPLLATHGARMELCVRSADGMTETHVLWFPDDLSFDAFLSDPARAALRDEWLSTGAMVTIADVRPISYSWTAHAGIPSG